MVRQNGAPFLLYAGSPYNTPTAGIGDGTCPGPLSACADLTRAAPWLGSSSRVKGPAGPAIFTAPDGTFRLAYHAWWPWPTDGSFPGYSDSVQSLRALWTDKLSFTGGTPLLG